MSFKDNLRRAAKELLSDGEERTAAGVTMEERLEEVLETARPTQGAAEPMWERPREPVAARPAPDKPPERPAASPAEPEPEPDEEPREEERFTIPSIPMELPPAPERTMIASGTIIVGDIQADGGVELRGRVQGDIISRHDLKLFGELIGDASGTDMTVQSGKVSGNLTALGDIVVDSRSVILGDVQAENMVLNGRIKGNLKVRSHLAVEGKALVRGNVTAGAVSMSTGAVLEGELRINDSDRDILDFFTDIEGMES